VKNLRYRAACIPMRELHVEYAIPNGTRDTSKPSPEALELLWAAIACLTKAATATTVESMFGQLDSAVNAIEDAVGAQKGS